MPISVQGVEICLNCHSVDAQELPDLSSTQEKKLKTQGRCFNYIQDVRRSTFYYLGLDYPWHYQMGCMKIESGCRASIVSSDGGIGVYQLTPSTGIVAVIKRDLGVPIDPYKPEDSIKAQAYFISKLINKFSKATVLTVGAKKHKIYPAAYTQMCGLRLADIYQFYNGGFWMYYEADLADSCDRKKMEENCVRTPTNCKINYLYPKRVYNYGNQFKLFDDGPWIFW